MSKLPSPISNYVERFRSQYNDLQIEGLNLDAFSELITQKKSQINNMLMSGLGASTLILRLSAVINLSIKLEEGSDEEDALLMKQILDNIREILPSDTNWNNVLKITCKKDSPWYEYVSHKKGVSPAFDKFITFRNRFVHEIITLNPIHSKRLLEGIDSLKFICENISLMYENTEFKEIDSKFYFIGKTDLLKSQKICIHPFVQSGSSDGLPYIFQGLYDKKTTAELIGTFYGDILEDEDSSEYDEVFNPMIKSLKGGAGKVFDHSDRFTYYNECFVGREQECEEILNWLKDSSETNNILPLYSSAGMGKGALVSNIISSSKEIGIPVLFHFCSSGMANNLQAILYHLILLAKKSQIWDTENDEIVNKLRRLPSKYPDLINFLHELIDNHFVKTRKNLSGNLLIVVDGLDEAAVTYPEYNISDYFNEYDENGEVTGKWESKPNVKWIFTYRQGFYNFPDLESIFNLDLVQPLNGLSVGSIESALSLFNPTSEFIETIAERGKVS
jgi:hypothetical protein